MKDANIIDCLRFCSGCSNVFRMCPEVWASAPLASAPLSHRRDSRTLSGVERADPERSRTGALLPIPKMCFVFTFGQFPDFSCRSVDQCFLFLSGPALHLLFPVIGFINSAVGFEIDQADRQAGFCMVGTFSHLVLQKPSIQIGCTTRIVTTICAFQYVHVPYHLSMTPIPLASATLVSATLASASLSHRSRRKDSPCLSGVEGTASPPESHDAVRNPPEGM